MVEYNRRLGGLSSVIITQTPLRISFAGGGTDFKGFYERDYGSVVSTAIDKYIYVIVKERFDDKIRVGYTRTEMVESVDEIQHELAREAMRMVGITEGHRDLHDGRHPLRGLRAGIVEHGDGGHAERALRL